MTPGGLGAVLSQQDEHGVERVIAYASRSLRPNEKNYSAYLLEMTAICWAIDHFHVYLYGNRFSVITDHRPLESMKTVHKKTLNRLQERLITYDFDLSYRPGKDNGPADALSRNPVDSVRAVMHTIQRDQAMDPDCCKIRETGGPYAVRDGILYRILRSESQGERQAVVLPRNARRRILKAAHDTPLTGHQGAMKCYHQVLSRYWWPNLWRDVQEYVRTCVTCQASKNPPRFQQQHAPHVPLPIPEAPNTRVHLDLFGPLKGGSEGFQLILVMTDALTKYVELVPLRDKKAETVADGFFNGWICRHSVPQEFMSDRGSEFRNKIRNHLCERLGIKTETTAAMHPQCNAPAEVVNKTIIAYMKATLESQNADWVALLPALQFAYNNRVHEATMRSPFYLMHGFEARLPDFEKQSYSESHAEDRIKDLQFALRKARELAVLKAKKAKVRTDKTAVQKDFEVGEDVMVFYPRSVFAQKAGNAKFAKQWHRYTIAKKIGPSTYLVSPQLSGARSSVVHTDRIKRFLHADNAQETAERLQAEENEFSRAGPEIRPRELTTQAGMPDLPPPLHFDVEDDDYVRPPPQLIYQQLPYPFPPVQLQVPDRPDEDLEGQYSPNLLSAPEQLSRTPRGQQSRSQTTSRDVSPAGSDASTSSAPETSRPTLAQQVSTEFWRPLARGRAPIRASSRSRGRATPAASTERRPLRSGGAAPDLPHVLSHPLESARGRAPVRGGSGTRPKSSKQGGRGGE